MKKLLRNFVSIIILTSIVFVFSCCTSVGNYTNTIEAADYTSTPKTVDYKNAVELLQNKTWIDTEIAKYIGEEEYKLVEPEYFLKDIDNDGELEIYISAGMAEGTCHADGRDYLINFVNGEPIMTPLLDWIEGYNPETGIFVNYDGNQGVFRYDITQFKSDGSVENISTITTYDGYLEIDVDGNSTYYDEFDEGYNAYKNLLAPYNLQSEPETYKLRNAPGLPLEDALNCKIKATDGEYIYWVGDKKYDEYGQMYYSSIFITDMNLGNQNTIYQAEYGEYVEFLGVKNGYVYFNRYEQGEPYDSYFNVIDVRTGEITQLCDTAADIMIGDDYIYFACGVIGEETLCYCKLDGSDKREITKDPFRYFSDFAYFAYVEDNKLYYMEDRLIDEHTEFRLIKSDINGDNPEVVIDWRTSGENFRSLVEENVSFVNLNKLYGEQRNYFGNYCIRYDDNCNKIYLNDEVVAEVPEDNYILNIINNRLYYTDIGHQQIYFIDINI